MKRKLITTVILALAGFNSAMADQKIQDDLIVVGSTCIGVDCLPGTDFDFDTLQLSAPNPGINFIDTSSSAQFPTLDWTLGVKGSEHGVSYLFVKDNASDIEVLKLSATEDGAVALGAGASLVDNAVSVGSPEVQRRITHLADGVNPTDGVNVRQLTQLESTFEPKVSELENHMAELLNRIEALNLRLDDLQ